MDALLGYLVEGLNPKAISSLKGGECVGNQPISLNRVRLLSFDGDGTS